MDFIDLCAGIGGFRVGMEEAGHRCIGFCEIDKYARITYKANFNTKGEWEGHDIRSVTDDDIRRIGNPSAICAGFPCQTFSIAGNRKGFEDTRGTIFFEIMRFASILRPLYLFLENVGGLLNHDGGDTFETILRTLDEFGYDAEWQVLNSKNFGVPQSRERVFIIGHLRGQCGRKIFPIGESNKNSIKQIIGGVQGQRVYDTGGVSVTLTGHGGGQGSKTGLYLFTKQENEIKIRNTVNCLDANYYKGLDCHQQRTGVLDVRAVLTPDRLEKRQNGRRIKESGEPMFTLTAQDKHGIMIYQRGRGYNKGGLHEIAPTLTKNSYQHNNHLINGARIRKLTPLECFRLQGFSDQFFYNAKYHSLEESKKILQKYPKHKGKRIFSNEERIERMSDSQLYKQAGNSVTTRVVRAIAERLV